MTARRASPDSDLQEAAAELLDRILAPCVEWSAFPAGHVYLNAAAAAKLTRIGLKRSWPDLLILHRVLHGIELKAGDEVVVYSQKPLSAGARLQVVDAIVAPAGVAGVAQ